MQKLRIGSRITALLLSVLMLVAYMPLLGEAVYADTITYTNTSLDRDVEGFPNNYGPVISSDKSEYKRGENIYIKIENSGKATSGGWIGIYDSYDVNSLTTTEVWAYTGNKTVNDISDFIIYGPDQTSAVKVNSGLAPGKHYIIHMANDGRWAVLPITITESDKIVTASVSIENAGDESTFYSGDDINISFETNDPLRGWVGVFKEGTDYSKSVVWFPNDKTGDTSTNIQPLISKKSEEEGPIEEGRYQVVYLDDLNKVISEPAYFNYYYQYNIPVESDWDWADDYTSATATLKAYGIPNKTLDISDADPLSEVVTAASCENTGETRHTASVTIDNDIVLKGNPEERTFTSTVYETINALGHDFEGAKWTNDPDNPGHQIRHCKRDGCNATQSREAHDHEMTEIPAKAATCTETGNNKYYQCSICKYYYKDEAGTEETTPEAEITTAALGHDFEGVEWTHDPDNRKHSRTCKREGCGYSETEDCTFERDSESSGVVTYKCSVCGGTYTDTLLSTNKTSYTFNEPIMVTAKGTGKDWVGLFDADATPASGGPQSYYYYYPADETETSVDIKTKTKQHSIDHSGEYKLVLLANDGYDVIASVPVTITLQSSLTVDRANPLVYGDPIKVTASSESADAWVGFYDYEDSLTELESTYYRSFNVADHDGEEINIFDMDEHFTDRPIKAKNYRFVMFSSGYSVDKIVTFPIVQKDMEADSISVESVADTPYTGKAITPELVIKDTVYGEEATLVRGTDYELEYANNTEEGTGTVTITGKGNYTGTRTVEFNITHSLTEVPAVPANCEEAGVKAYWTCSACGKKFADKDGKTEITEPEKIPATGHAYELTGWTWADDHSAATAAFTCSHDASHVEKAEAVVEEEVIKTPKCEEAGESDFFATAEFEGSKYTDTASGVAVPALGHNLTKVDAKEATTEAEGNIEYWTCPECGKYFSDAEGKTEIKKDDTVIPKKEEPKPDEPTPAEKAIAEAKEALSKAVDEAKTVEQGNYTDESFKALQDAIADAEALAKDDKATADELKAAATKVEEAKKALKEKEEVKPDEPAPSEPSEAEKAVKEALDKAIAEAKELIKDKESDAAYKDLQDAIAETEALVNDKTATPEKLKEAAAKLAGKISDAKKAADEAEKQKAETAAAKEDLSKAVDDAKKVEQGNYTDESYKALQDAIAEAEALAKDDKATAEQLKAASDKVAAAKAGLKENEAATAEPATKVGDTVKYYKNTYKVTSVKSKTVAFTKAKNAKSVVVPATMKIKGVVYKVTAVNAKAFTAKKIRTVTIGKNVKQIKKYAFKSSKATKIILKTKALKKSKVKGSLKSSKIKTVQVKITKKASKTNKTYVKKYKKYFTKANAGRKVTVK